MVFDFLKTASFEGGEQKASAVGSMMAIHSGGRAVWSGRDTGALTRNGFTGNPVGFRCVKLIAEAVGSIPLRLQDPERGYDTHPILTLLQKPNGLQSGADLAEHLVGQMLLSGDGYIEAACLGDGLPRELYVLRSERMRVVPGADGWPAAYEYSVGAKKHRFAMTEDVQPILHLKSFHPQDDHYGLSPLQAAANALDVHNAASKWSKALLDNAARPSGALVYKSSDGFGTLAQDQYQRLVDEIEVNHQGARNAGRPMLLEGGLDWKPMGFSPSDMEFHKTKDTAAREVALAFGVPPMLLGLPGDNTYANYQEANRAFYRLTVLPLAARIAAGLANWLGQFSDENLTLKPDLDSVPALATEREAQWNRVANADFLSAAEKRSLLGLPKLVDE